MRRHAPRPLRAEGAQIVGDPGDELPLVLEALGQHKVVQHGFAPKKGFLVACAVPVAGRAEFEIQCISAFRDGFLRFVYGFPYQVASFACACQTIPRRAVRYVRTRYAGSLREHLCNLRHAGVVDLLKAACPPCHADRREQRQRDSDMSSHVQWFPFTRYRIVMTLPLRE